MLYTWVNHLLSLFWIISEKLIGSQNIKLSKVIGDFYPLYWPLTTFFAISGTAWPILFLFQLKLDFLVLVFLSSMMDYCNAPTLCFKFGKDFRLDEMYSGLEITQNGVFYQRSRMWILVILKEFSRILCRKHGINIRSG